MKGLGFFRKKMKSVNGVRYIEVEGVRYAVGIGYIVELAKAYNAKYNTDAGIDEVLQKCFGNTKVTPQAIADIVMALRVSINYYRTKVGEPEVDDAYIESLIDSRGFGYIGRVLVTLAGTLTSVMLAGGEQPDDKAEAEANDQKKS